MFKRILCISACVISILLTAAIVIFVLIKTGILDFNKIDPFEVRTFVTDDGLTYTEKIWTWKPIESKKIISYHENVADKTVTVSLALDNSRYYDIKIPDVPYIYDFGKTVWAEDGSFMIRVVGQANMDTLAALAGIDNGENINQYTLRSKDGVKGARTLATLIDDVAIIVNVYEGDSCYSIIRDSIANNHASYVIDEIPYSSGCKTLTSLKYSGSFTRSVINDGSNSLSQSKYLFEGGALWIQTVVLPYDQAVRYSLEKLVTSSRSGKVEQVYKTDKVSFASSGNYYVAVVYINTNTSLTFVGEGEEALCNIVSMLSMYG